MILEKKSFKSLKKLAWTLCSQYIRKRDCPNGYGKCFTCLNAIEYSNCDAGHYIHGSTKATYFLEENIHGQCKKCNLYLSGNGVVYTIKMIDKYGRKKVDDLFILSKKAHTHTRKELIELILQFQDKLEQIT